MINETVYKKFYNTLSQYNIHKKVYIALSGGIDSSTLINLFYKYSIEHKIKIKLIHVNHSFSSFSNSWENFCIKKSKNIKLPIKIIRIKKKFDLVNIEQNFRNIRFNFFFHYCTKTSSLTLAHNNDDNVETILTNIFHGAGTEGMSGIKLKNIDYKFNIYRPIVNITKMEILDYSVINKISYIQDFSNFNTKFNRNFLRYKILPLLNAKYINNYNLFNNLTNFNLQKFLFFFYKNSYFINRNKYNLKRVILHDLLIIPKIIKDNFLRSWFKFNFNKYPSRLILNEINKLINLNNYKNAYLKYKNYVFKKNKYYLFFYRNTLLKKSNKKFFFLKNEKQKNIFVNYFCLYKKKISLFQDTKNFRSGQENYTLFLYKRMPIIICGIFCKKKIINLLKFKNLI
jgi:tRNA(Ile)-lysidine synthase